MYINGAWVEGAEAFTTVNPATGQAFGSVYQASEENVAVAVEAARTAYPEWRALAVGERSKILAKAADLLLARYGEQGEITDLKQLIMSEMGKRLPEADIEVVESSDMIRFFANEATRLLSPTQPKLDEQLWPTKRSVVVCEPIGVVGVIKPWNYPLEIPIWAIAPALVAGNVVVFKPSEYSTFVGLEIGKLFEEAELPAGVLNIITGDGEVGKMIVRQPKIDMISFTGSVAVGREISEECGKQLKKCNLELGGSDPAIVEEDVDLELAANGLVWGAFCNAGQVCVRTKRAFVNKAIAEGLIQLIVEKTRALRAGVDFGPIVSETQLSRLEDQVADAIGKGAEVLCGGSRVAELGGSYYSPTVITNVNSSMRVMTEECFGPVLPIVIVTNTQEAIELSNDTVYGLGASVWTSDLQKGERISNSIQAGMVWVNDVNVAYAQAPWGGIKDSGIGVELSEWGLFEYVHRKHINLETSSDTHRYWWYPYKEPSVQS